MSTKSSSSSSSLSSSSSSSLQPARKQAKMENRSRVTTEHQDGSAYNIWYHKFTGDGEDEHRKKMREERNTRLAQLDVTRDCGETRGSRMVGKKPYICLHFARGECDQGGECLFLHRLPTAEDERSLDMFHDIFGREKHREERDDMCGVGSFMRDGKSLYITGLQNSRARKMETILQAYFGQFGDIEYIRVINEKNIAFLRYQRRTSAEFAKEATHERSLLVGRERKEMINVKWANDDPNPVSKKIEENHKVDLYNAAMFKWWQTLKDSQQMYYQYQEYLNRLSQASASGDAHEYPDTNHQYMTSYLSSYLSTLSASLPPIDFASMTPEEAAKAYQEYKSYKEYYDMYAAWTAASAGAYPTYDPTNASSFAGAYDPNVLTAYDPSTFSYYGGGSASFAPVPGGTSCAPLSSNSIFYTSSSSSSLSSPSSVSSASSSLFSSSQGQAEGDQVPYYPFAEGAVKEEKREEKQ